MPGMLAVEAGAHGAFVLDWRGVVAVLSVSPECAFGLPMSRNCSRFLCDLPSLYCRCFAPIKNSMMLA